MNTKTLLSSSDVQCKADTCSHMCLPGKNGPVCLCPNGLANQKICAGMSHSNICFSVLYGGYYFKSSRSVLLNIKLELRG